jgi:hypothetical protein
MDQAFKSALDLFYELEGQAIKDQMKKRFINNVKRTKSTLNYDVPASSPQSYSFAYSTAYAKGDKVADKKK